jgi:hypothetical protein
MSIMGGNIEHGDFDSRPLFFLRPPVIYFIRPRSNTHVRRYEVIMPMDGAVGGLRGLLDKNQTT